MNDKIRFAVVGYGHIGTRHADMIKQHADCQLVAIVDTDISKKKSADKGSIPFFTSIHSLLQSGIEIDIINIASPNGLHAQQAIECLNAGKHIVVEKPLALNSADSRNILQTAASKNLKVFCVMQNRYSAPMQWLNNILTEGKLGKIFMVNISCYWNRDERYYSGDTWHGTNNIDGGTLFTQFSHYVDLLYWLFGDVNIKSAHFANHNHEGIIEFEDSGIVDFQFIKGGVGSLVYTTSVWDKNMESSMVIVGEKGTVKIAGQYMDKIEYCHIKDYEPANDINSQQLVVPGYNNAKANHYFVIQNVVDVLNGKSEITTTAEEGAIVVDIIERIYALK